jgi:hypothetical protein
MAGCGSLTRINSPKASASSNQISLNNSGQKEKEKLYGNK